MKQFFSTVKTIFHNSQSGQSLMELMVTIGLAAIIIPALLTGFFAARSGRAQGEQRQIATALAREGQEAARVYREADWTTFAALSGKTVYAKPQGSTWTLTTTPQALPAGYSGFSRTITISDVWRDSSFNIVAQGAGAYNDNSTKLVTTTVTWSSPLSTSITASEYLTRTENLSFTDTSVSDFSRTGSIFSTTQAYSPSSSTTSSDGTVILGQSALADWCSPGTPIAHTDLGGNGLAGSVVAGVNRAFVGTGQNASSHPFYNVTIDYSGAAPAPSVAGNAYYDISGLKSNDVFGETRGSTSYAYLATAHNGNRWVVILNVTSNPPSLVTTIASQNNNDASSIFVSNNILYFTAGNVLYRYDIANPASPVAKGTFTLNASANKIYVVGGYVYIALASTTTQLQIVDATDATTMKNPGSGAALLSLGNQQAIGLYVLADGTRAYLITALGSTNQKDFYIVNTSSKSSPSVVTVGGINGLSTGTMNPKGITVIDNRAILVGFTNPRYQVIKVKDSGGSDSYSSCAAVNEPDDIYNVSSQYVGSHAYSYITTANTSSAFEMIEGGAGGGGQYVSSGTYTSGYWPSSGTPALTAFNRVDITVNKPVNTDIQFQVAVADAGASTTCSDATFTFVGPTGPGSYYTTGTSDGTDRSIPIPLPFPGTSGWSSYINPGKCFAYKAIFTTSDTTQTPILKDVTVNYSP